MLSNDSLFINSIITCFSASNCPLNQTIGNNMLGECCSNTIRSFTLGTLATCVDCAPITCYKSASCNGPSITLTSNTLDQCCSEGNSALLTGMAIPLFMPVGHCVRCPSRGSSGEDPHFAVLLPSKQQLCFTVQGEPGFIFNLVEGTHLTVNAMFVQDRVRKEVTWIGTLAVVVDNTRYSKVTLRFEADKEIVYINERTHFYVRNISEISFGKKGMNVKSTPKRNPSQINVNIRQIGLKFTIDFVGQHLDTIYHKIPSNQHNSSYRGLLGQFFCKGHNIDEVRKLLLFPMSEREPIPVMRRPIWSFMERESGTPDHLCWMAMNVGYQGEGLIQGHYLDYVRSDLFSTTGNHFKT